MLQEKINYENLTKENCVIESIFRRGEVFTTNINNKNYVLFGY